MVLSKMTAIPVSENFGSVTIKVPFHSRILKRFCPPTIKKFGRLVSTRASSSLSGCRASVSGAVGQR